MIENMNRVWTRDQGLILTNWKIGEKVYIGNSTLIRSLMSTIRNRDYILFNDVPHIIKNLTIEL